MKYRLDFCSEEILINADPLKLVRAFENLVINAIKYGGGSGLGLAITKNIIENHNGNILVTSDNEKTVFEVKIPLKVDLC